MSNFYLEALDFGKKLLSSGKKRLRAQKRRWRYGVYIYNDLHV